MALSGLDIYKLLPKTNCKDCGFVTCLAFAMQLAKKAVSIDKCPYLSDEAKKVLAESSLPPIKLITVGEGKDSLQVGNETVLFRHEEKFHHPCGLGVIIDSTLGEPEIDRKLKQISKLNFERVGQALSVNLIAVKQGKDKGKFIETVKKVNTQSSLGIVLMGDDLSATEAALKIAAKKKPLLYGIREADYAKAAALVKECPASIVVSHPELQGLSESVLELNKLGATDLVLDTAKKGCLEKLHDFTQIRRQALKKGNRSLGYPVIAVIDDFDPYEEAIEAATCICKYASIILVSCPDSWQAFSLLTLRQNIYTDPQKPLQIEPNLYPVGQVNKDSPVLITTNFSLSYYTVLGEVEASKIPAYIVSVDTEGMSVLTAWAAEKFTPEKINDSIEKFGVKDAVSHKSVVIPGYVAVISGDLEEKSGRKVIVGPKEAAGIPSFLKNLT